MIVVFGLQIEHLSHLLANKDEYKQFAQPIRLPLDMSKKVVGMMSGEIQAIMMFIKFLTDN